MDVAAGRCAFPRVLVIQLARLGDAVQTLPLLKRVKETHPHGETTVLCLARFNELLKQSPFVDRRVDFPDDVLQYPAGDDPQYPVEHWGRWRGIHPALCDPYDLVVNFSHDRAGASLCAGLDARKRSGVRSFQRDGVKIGGGWGKYLFAQVSNRALNLFNLVDIHVGMGDVEHAAVRGALPLSDDCKRLALQLLAESGYRAGCRTVAFHMGANEPHRTWPPPFFAELASRLAGGGGWQVVLLGGASDSLLGRHVSRRSGVTVVDLVGKTGLWELAAVLSACDVLVSNDTGPIHLAAAVGTPAVGLYFSSAYFSETAPYGEGHVVLQSDRPCCPCWKDSLCKGIPCRADITPGAAEWAVRRATGEDRSTPPPGIHRVSFYESRFQPNGLMLYHSVGVETERYKFARFHRRAWETALLRASRGLPAGVGPDAPSRGAAPGGPPLGSGRPFISSCGASAVGHAAVHSLEMLRERLLAAGGAAVAMPGHRGWDLWDASFHEAAQVLSDGGIHLGMLKEYFFFELMDLEAADPAITHSLLVSKMKLMTRIVDCHLEAFRGGDTQVPTWDG